MPFSRGATGLSHMPLCFELVLRVTVEPVAGESGLSGVHWTSESFEMVHDPGVPLECQVETASF